MERAADHRGREGKVIGFPTERGETPTLRYRKGERREERGGGQSPMEGRGLSLRRPPIHVTQSLHTFEILGIMLHAACSETALLRGL